MVVVVCTFIQHDYICLTRDVKAFPSVSLCFPMFPSVSLYAIFYKSVVEFVHVAQTILHATRNFSERQARHIAQEQE